MHRSRIFRAIVNLNKPKCIDCSFFLKQKPLDMSKCYRFGKADLVTGIINYDYADICRLYPDMCGVDGKYFDKCIFLVEPDLTK